MDLHVLNPQEYKRRVLEGRLYNCMYAMLAPEGLNDFIQIRYLRVHPTHVGGAR
jgi:hypothetical protein